MRLVPLPVPLAPDLVGPVTGWLERACARPGCDLTVGALLALSCAGEGQLIGVSDGERLVAAGATQVRRHADGRLSCWVLALGGAAAGPWSAVIAAVEAGAARLGCTSVDFIGRRGWARALPDFVAAPCANGLHFSKDLTR